MNTCPAGSITARVCGAFSCSSSGMRTSRPMPASTNPSSLRPFSAVICTRNRPDSLCRAVDSVLRNSELLRELWIMDQSDDHRTAEMAARVFHEDPRVHVIHHPFQNKSRAANRAAELAQGEFLAFIDDDCQAQPHWLA